MGRLKSSKSVVRETGQRNKEMLAIDETEMRNQTALASIHTSCHDRRVISACRMDYIIIYSKIREDFQAAMNFYFSIR